MPLLSLLGTGTSPGLVVVESALPAGGMTPLHAHDDDEALQVADGTVTVYLADEIVTLGAGDSVLVPRGVAHTVRAETAARLVTATYVTSAGRYEDFLRAVARARPGDPLELLPDEAAGLAHLADVNGIAVLGPPGALPGSVDGLLAA
jgi:quercetin dioxygenase-like cupin family protein